MRELAEAFAAAGFDVEMPRLPGHGTHVDDMLPTRWADCVAEAEAAYQRLAVTLGQGRRRRPEHGRRADPADGRRPPEIAGLVCINAATAADRPEDMVADDAGDGRRGRPRSMPGIGSDIADPDVTETAYEGTPLGPLLSLDRRARAAGARVPDDAACRC